jgi:hypothetical protein
MPESKLPLAAFSEPMAATTAAPPRLPAVRMTPTAVLPTWGPRDRSCDAAAMAMGRAARRKKPTPPTTTTSGPSEPRWPRSQSPGAAATPAAIRNGFLRPILSLARPSTTDPAIPAIVMAPATRPAPLSPKAV